MDLAKYRALFVEEATEHLAEMSRALLTLEKEPDRGEAIDTVFRMAHSVKGMAASLDYEALTELAHRLEDRMAAVRDAGRVEGEEGLALLFRGLEGLERMVESVRESGEPPSPDPALAEALAAPPDASSERAESAQKKKRPTSGPDP